MPPKAEAAYDLRLAGDEIGRENDASNQTQHAARRRIKQTARLLIANGRLCRHQVSWGHYA